jgi:hypothetical protein
MCDESCHQLWQELSLILLACYVPQITKLPDYSSHPREIPGTYGSLESPP